MAIATSSQKSTSNIQTNRRTNILMSDIAYFERAKEALYRIPLSIY